MMKQERGPRGSVNGGELRVERLAAGITQADVAQRMGVSHNRLVKAERGWPRLTEKFAARYRFALAEAIAYKEGRGEEFGRWKKAVQEAEARRPVRGSELRIERTRRRVGYKALAEVMGYEAFKIENMKRVPAELVERYRRALLEAWRLKQTAR